MKYFVSLSASLLIIFTLLGYWTNRQLEKTALTLPIKGLPSELEGFKILHLSDIHYAHLRVPEAHLLATVNTDQPDVIVVTGDTIDRTEDVTSSNIQALINQLAALAPTFVIEGNHERSSGQFEEWRQLMLTSEATLIENDYVSLPVGTQRLNLIGLGNAVTALPPEKTEAFKAGAVNLLLAHHPELIETYLTNFSTIPLHGIFSGHAHGGQVRLPGIDGLLAPNQGFFPTYTNGAYTLEAYPETHLFVSRGLSNSSFPLRIFNKPHVISVTLANKK